MLEVIKLVGLPASGKTTFANNYIKENPNYLIVSRDSIRESLVPNHRNTWYKRKDRKKLEDLVTLIENYQIKMMLYHEYNVIVDSTGFRQNFNLEDVLNQFSFDKLVVREKCFTDVPLTECIRRDKEREFPVGKEVITKMYKTYKNKFNLKE